MIKIDYNNKELERLITKGKSSLYKGISRKKSFMKTLQAFSYLLRFLFSTEDLLLYKQYHYKRYSSTSLVLINGSGIQRKLLFSERDQGKSIIINDLIL